MRNFIVALGIALLLQTAALAGLGFWQADHQLNLSREYSLLVEQRVNDSLAAEVTRLRRDITAWRLEDQESMRTYVDRVIGAEHSRGTLPTK